ncbi:TIGR02234 family membrane protein [Nocardia otitidiscaviarum]|uniref:TIGR02234 family membrane protein n=1 Tax=Nocardia otitidiscaviarum TaxID=1823 RepID=UPI00189339AD|nr:TIGR02234 family membrane protein [Nocardia otitidiscaviarum]MBF6176986.1 TIGR02234 family membrane protein [Nocardia otitidiscaviarum]
MSDAADPRSREPDTPPEPAAAGAGEPAAPDAGTEATSAPRGATAERAGSATSATSNPSAAQPDSTSVVETVSGSVDPVIRAEIEAGAVADEQGAQPDTPRQRKPIVAVLLLAVAAGALWASSRMTWVSIGVSSELGAPRDIDLDGGTWFGALTPLALALVATIAAVFATRGWPRRIVGVVVALLAAVAAVPEYALLRGEGQLAERAGRLAELRDWEHVVSTQTATAPAAVALVGAVAAFLAGVLLVRMPSDTGRLSGKYDNPAVRRSAAAAEVAQRRAAQTDQRRAAQTDQRRAAQTDQRRAGETDQRRAESASQPAPGEQLSGRVLWDALDAGDDPTDEAANTSAAHDDPDTGSAGRPTR